MSSLIYNYELIKRKKLTVSNKHKKQLVYLVQFKNKYDIKEIKKYLQDCFNRPIKKKREQCSNLAKIPEIAESYFQ